MLDDLKEKDLDGHLKVESKTANNTKDKTESKVKSKTTNKADNKTNNKAENSNKASAQQILAKQDKNKTKAIKEAIAKLHKDYFVHEATNLLKALMILNQPATDAPKQP